MRKKILFATILFCCLGYAGTAQAAIAIDRAAPRIVSRAAWGADESFRFLQEGQEAPQPKLVTVEDEFYVRFADELKITRSETHENGQKMIWPFEYPESMQKIIVHHTALEGNGRAPQELIRAMYRNHAVQRGWGDIGYNYLIDPQGNIYEGRAGGESVVGAHAGRGNVGTIGIALLGNFNEETPSYEAVMALVRLVRDTLKLHNLDPLGITTFRGEPKPTIIGHKDISPTSCPGANFYDSLPALRQLVAYLDDRPAPASALQTQVDFEEVGDHPPLVFHRSVSERTITLRLKNTGTTPWGEGTYLAANRSNDLTFVRPDHTDKAHWADLQEPIVRPGEIGTFQGTLTRGRRIGLTNVQLTVFANGTEGAASDLLMPIYIEQSPVPSRQEVRGALEGEIEPVRIRVGRAETIEFSMRNTGDAAWKKQGAKRAQLSVTAAGGIKKVDSGIREDSVAPGAVGTFFLTVKAAWKIGDYTLVIRPKAERKRLTKSAIKLPITIYREHRVPRKTTQEIKEPIMRIQLTGIGSSITLRIDDKEQIVRKEDVERLGILRFEGREPMLIRELGKSYRGVIEARIADGALTIINEVPMETYLKGLAEAGPDEPMEKIKALTIAARTYAEWYRESEQKFPGKPYHLDDTPQRSQWYVGAKREAATRQQQAVDETRGIIVTYNDKVIKTPYFHASDGRTRSAEEVWGWTHTPYLQSVPDFCSTGMAGHGVGLSGCGATEAARQGLSAEAILKHYYQGVELKKVY